MSWIAQSVVYLQISGNMLGWVVWPPFCYDLVMTLLNFGVSCRLSLAFFSCRKAVLVLFPIKSQFLLARFLTVLAYGLYVVTKITLSSESDDEVFKRVFGVSYSVPLVERQRCCATSRAPAILCH
jgi:uncharacterized membrane protein